MTPRRWSCPCRILQGSQGCNPADTSIPFHPSVPSIISLPSLEICNLPAEPSSEALAATSSPRPYGAVTPEQDAQRRSGSDLPPPLLGTASPQARRLGGELHGVPRQDCREATCPSFRQHARPGLTPGCLGVVGKHGITRQVGGKGRSAQRGGPGVPSEKEGTAHRSRRRKK